MFQVQGELGFPSDFNGHAGREQKGNAADKKGLSLREVFRLGKRVGDVAEGQDVFTGGVPALFHDDFVSVNPVSQRIYFEGTEAVFREGVGAVFFRREFRGFCRKAPCSVVEGFVHDGGEPEVTGFPGGGVPLVFAVSKGLKTLLKEGDLVHGRDVTQGRKQECMLAVLILEALFHGIALLMLAIKICTILHMTKKYKVFLSHACADKALANRFMAFLQSAGSIAHGKIYNTDKTDQQIDNDKNYPQEMLDALRDSDVVIFLISNNFLSRPNCSIELGAALAHDKNRIYLLVPPVTHENLPGFLAGKQAGGNIDGEKTLWNLKEALSSCIEDGEGKTAHWNEQCDEFIDELPGILEGIEQIARITQEEFDAQKKAADNYKELFRGKKEELKSLQSMYDQLRDLKDADEVNEMEWELMDEAEKYEKLVEDAQHEMSPFDSCMKYFIYSTTFSDIDEYFNPESYDLTWDDVMKNVRKKYIVQNIHRDEFLLNRDMPYVKDALESLYELNSFLSEECGEKFRNALTAKLGFPPDLSNIDYWNELF